MLDPLRAQLSPDYGVTSSGSGKVCRLAGGLRRKQTTEVDKVERGRLEVAEAHRVRGSVQVLGQQVAFFYFFIFYFWF